EAQRQRGRAERARRAEAGEAVAGDVHRRETDAGDSEAVGGLPATRFVGYDRLTAPAQVLALFRDGTAVERVPAGTEVDVVLDVTPFYAEAGGQVGDQGWLEAPGLRVQVRDTVRRGGVILHRSLVDEGEARVGTSVRARVDAERRQATARNHSATHLLHRALREVLGAHVNQAGSLVAPDRLRFDFTHFRPLTAEQLRAVERLVNEQVLAALPVQTFEAALEEARAMGAVALFGEKYGERVRVVRMGDFSMELCGGTHVANTAAVGLFKVVSEQGIGAGVRRIEAVTGMGFLAYAWRQEEILQTVAAGLRTQPADVAGKVTELLERVRVLERELAERDADLARQEAERLLAGVREESGVRLVVGEVPIRDAAGLRALADHVRNRLGSGVVLLGARAGGRVLFLAAVTPDLVAARGLHAGRLAGSMARV
ncbi:MAG: alanine--tRNA ligase, partial [Clostridia bacterium]|nr:alanine--tRNA ligase [Clostridia bacterium]